MTSPSASTPGTAREAAERNAQAVMAGNLAQIMGDITPEALTQMMQMAAQAGGMSPSEGDGELFHVTFNSPQGHATLAATWKQVMGQWKITAISLVSAEQVQQ